ncbi:MAG: molybdenum cofactor guanylyltransferase [Pseudomonadota bacterium]|nr:molybdenum cofactor guanylyltransferase [Pseudomonadota bacterium]
MNSKPDIPVCILAGGAASRFGENKALADLAEKPMVCHVLDRIADQTAGEVAINANDARPFSDFGLRILPDRKWEKAGPLAGIYAALQWASQQGFDSVVTVAVDIPFLPKGFISDIVQTAPPAIAASMGRWHPVNGIWGVRNLPVLDAYLGSGRRSAHGWAEYCRANVAQFTPLAGQPDPFWNVNTKEDLEQANAMLAQKPER